MMSHFVETRPHHHSSQFRFPFSNRSGNDSPLPERRLIRQQQGQHEWMPRRDPISFLFTPLLSA
jgi:hypothetical protein